MKKSNPKINTLQLITGLGMGGAEKVVLDISRFMDKTAFNNYIISISNRVELLEEFKSKNIQVQVLNSSKSLKGFFKTIKKIKIFVQSHKINIIHAHLTHAMIVATFLKLIHFPTIQVVFSPHSVNLGSKFRGFLTWILSPLRNSDILFSNHIKKYYNSTNIKIIPNGIDVPKYNLSLPKNKVFTIIAIGRLEMVKNHLFLIELASKLKNKIEFQLNIVGNGNLITQLQTKIKDLEVEDCVCLMGLRNDIPTLLNRSHCMVLPSLWEGLPIVLLEAGASSVPVISTNVGSIPCLINHETGYLSDLENFQRTIEHVFFNYQEANQKAKVLFGEIKNNYSINSIVIEHEKLYKSLIC